MLGQGQAGGGLGGPGEGSVVSSHPSSKPRSSCRPEPRSPDFLSAGPCLGAQLPRVGRLRGTRISSRGSSQA